MINDPRSCSLIKTRRAKMHQEGVPWRCSGGFWSPPVKNSGMFSFSCFRLREGSKGRRGESKMAGSCGCFFFFIVRLFFRSM